MCKRVFKNWLWWNIENLYFSSHVQTFQAITGQESTRSINDYVYGLCLYNVSVRKHNNHHSNNKNDLILLVYFLKSTDVWIQDGEFPNMVGGAEWKDWTKNLEQLLFNSICLWSCSIFYIVQTVKTWVYRLLKILSQSWHNICKCDQAVISLSYPQNSLIL